MLLREEVLPVFALENVAGRMRDRPWYVTWLRRPAIVTIDQALAVVAALAPTENVQPSACCYASEAREDGVGGTRDFPERVQVRKGR